MTQHLIKALITALPRFAEEEGDYYPVKRTDLIAALCQKADIAHEVAENTVNLCETLLDTLATLKPDCLLRGEWCFVSFPAQLMALSVLTAMSDPDSRYFEADFWNTHSIGDTKKNSQRDVLAAVENKRHDSHLRKTAAPIRYIYVAWGLIKHDGCILLHQREDTKKRYDSNAGDYSLVGGRVNQKDLQHLTGDIRDKLQALQSANNEQIRPALTETLERELREEAGLEYEQHYYFMPWRTLKPYRQVQGTAPNHALTEYYIDIYVVVLTLEGFCFLQQKIADNEKLVWFSLDEIAQGHTGKEQTQDSKIAFLKALYKDFGDNRARLKHELEILEDSFNAKFSNIKNQDKYRIVLPQDEGQPIRAGAPGKEAPVDLSLLDKPKLLSLLSGLAAHLRGFRFVERHSAVTLHPHGWLEVKDNCELQGELARLAEECKHSEDIVVENQKDRWFRLSISPDCVFFDDAYYSCYFNQMELGSREGKNTHITIIRRKFVTRLGMVDEDTKKVQVSCGLEDRLRTMSENKVDGYSDEAKQTYDLYRKGLHSDCLQMGMRGLLRQDAKAIKTCCEFRID